MLTILVSSGMRLLGCYQVLWCTFYKLHWRRWNNWKLCMFAWGGPWHPLEAPRLENWLSRSTKISATDSVIYMYCGQLWIWFLLALLPGELIVYIIRKPSLLVHWFCTKLLFFPLIYNTFWSLKDVEWLMSCSYTLYLQKKINNNIIHLWFSLQIHSGASLPVLVFELFASYL